jgi:hypothetical protein
MVLTPTTKLDIRSMALAKLKPLLDQISSQLRLLGEGAAADHMQRSKDVVGNIEIDITFERVIVPKQVRVRRQKDAIADLAVDQFGTLPCTTAAKQLAIEFERYQTCAWRRDRERPAMPANYQGDALRAGLFRIFQAGDGRVPTSVKQIGRIIAHRFRK